MQNMTHNILILLGLLSLILNGCSREGPKVSHCPDCGVSSGQLHEPFCLKERCPFCQGQSATCGCIITVLQLNDVERTAVEEFEDDEVEPLKGIVARWEEALAKKGRVPFR